MGQTIRLKQKVSQGDLQLQDLQPREIVFDNNKFTLVIRNNEGDRLIYFPNLNNNEETDYNTWSQTKLKKEIRKSFFLS